MTPRIGGLAATSISSDTLLVNSFADGAKGGEAVVELKLSR